LWHNGKLPNAFEGSWMILPKGVTVVLMINTVGGLNPQPEQLIPPAWNAAW
jgi:hypothetical protein